MDENIFVHSAPDFASRFVTITCMKLGMCTVIGKSLTLSQMKVSGLFCKEIFETIILKRHRNFRKKTNKQIVRTIQFCFSKKGIFSKKQIEKSFLWNWECARSSGDLWPCPRWRCPDFFEKDSRKKHLKNNSKTLIFFEQFNFSKSAGL